MFCNKCGAELEEGAKFCNVCGAPVEQVAEETKAAAEEAAQEAAPAPVDESANWTAAEDEETGFTKKQVTALIRTLSIGSYLFVGLLVIAIIFFRDKKYVTHHVNNALVLAIFLAGASLISAIPYFGWVVGPIILIYLAVMEVLCIVKAAQGKTFKMPILGGIRILKPQE